LLGRFLDDMSATTAAVPDACTPEGSTPTDLPRETR
jgi:hypothetical protein